MRRVNKVGQLFFDVLAKKVVKRGSAFFDLQLGQAIFLSPRSLIERVTPKVLSHFLQWNS